MEQFVHILFTHAFVVLPLFPSVIRRHLSAVHSLTRPPEKSGLPVVNDLVPRIFYDAAAQFVHIDRLRYKILKTGL